MYIYYILRGTLADKIEREGDIDAEQFPGVDLDDGPAITTYMTKHIITRTGAVDRMRPDRRFLQPRGYVSLLRWSLDAQVRYALAEG